MNFDTLIQGGTVIDGSGSPGFKAAIGIRDGLAYVVRGNTDTISARERVDARGQVVSPGFIDLHSHTGLKLLQDPYNEAKISQGVTTELIGVDGLSYVPFINKRDLLDFVRTNAGLDGAPNLNYDWDTFQSYMSLFDGAASVNVACLIGNSALRINSVGWEQREARNIDIANMRSMLREALQEGAYGMSSGLDYPPGSFASTDELIELCHEVSEVGGIYHTHVRYWLGDRFLDPFREAFEIADRSETALHLTHLHAKASNPGGSARIFDLLEEWQGRGADVTFDNFPYEHGSSRLSVYLPQWIQSGRPDEIVERLASKKARERFKADLEESGLAGDWMEATKGIRVGGFSKSRNRVLQNESLWDIAVAREEHVVDALCSILVEEDLQLMQVDPAATSVSLSAFVTHPLAMVGTDATFVGDKPSPRSYGSFPRILGELVREERLLSLPDAIRKFTSFPAQRLGLPDRGLLRDKFCADITVFDADTVKGNATYDEPTRPSDGINYVFVNGNKVWENGVHTKTLPGRSLRRHNNYHS